MFQLYERFDSAISTADVHTELSDRIMKSWIIQEKRQLKLYQLMLKDERQSGGECQSIILSFLLQERAVDNESAEGQKLMAWLETEPSQDARNQVAMNMFRAWYVPFYFYGENPWRPASRQLFITRFKHQSGCDWAQPVFSVPNLSQALLNCTARWSHQMDDLARHLRVPGLRLDDE